MTKRNRIIYRISTAWLCLGMISTGFVQLFGIKEQIQFVLDMGYPAYFITLLGICKVIGVVVVLLPKFPLLKEWAYAGFFFSMSGAIFSHMALGHSVNELFPPLLLLVLTAISWYFRPSDRKIILAHG
jgi:hypothetical protein